MQASYRRCYVFAMKRLAIVLVLAACSSGQKKTPGAGSGSAAIYAKKISIGWGFQATGTNIDVFLQTTDETGHQVSYPVGTYPGECKPIVPAAEMKALTGAACKGLELHAVVQDQEIIILKLRTDQGTPDPMAREEVTRIKAPGGAAIEAGT
jgi:hypothetical protein